MTVQPLLLPTAPPPDPPATRPGRLGICCLGGLLLGLTVAAYLPVWRNDFVNYDDEPNITPNPDVRQGLTASSFVWAWTNSLTAYWMPLTWLSLQFDAEFFSTRTPEGEVVLSPAAFHGDNLFWHAASVLLLFALGLRISGAPGRSFLLAALFAVHPMHVESVAWAIERKDVLSTFFGLLTLWLYLRWVEKPGRPRYLAVAVAYSASLLAKPMLMTLPVVLLLLDYWPLRRWGAASAAGTTGAEWPRVSFGRLIREKGPLFVLAGGMALITLNTREAHGALVSLDALPLSARLGNALVAYGEYLFSTLYPIHLCVMYPHPRGAWSGMGALLGAGLLAGLTALALWQRKRRPWLLVGWLWFAVTLVPVSGLFQGGKQAWADRFTYWPHIGLFLAIAWEAADRVVRWRVPALVSGAAAALVLGSLAALTWVQVGYWRNSITLWERALAVTRDNDFALQYLSVAYRKAGRVAEADACSDEVDRIRKQRNGLPVH